MATTNLGDRGRTLYQGSIEAYDLNPRQPYQGNVDTRNLKPGRLYQGTIKPGVVKAKPSGNVPAKSNPYRYYKLPENYYGNERRKNRVRPLSAAQPRKKIDKEPTKNKRSEPKKRKIAPAKTQDKPVAPAKTQEKPVAPAKTQEKPVAEKSRPLPAIKWSEERPKTPPKRPPTQKPKSRENQRTNRVSPFPPPSPEPTPRHVPKRNPDPMRSQSYHNQNLPQPIFPPILPVTMEDFVNREPAWRSEPDQRRGNGLIPYVNPPLASSKTGLSKYRRSPDNFFEENYHDSLTRSFTNVPGYNAVGSILRSMDMYY